MTSAAAPAGTTARDRRSLPPFPEEVSLPATFGDWYDTAADALGRAERRDSGAVRLLAGAAMLAGVSAGVGLLAEPLVVLAGAGAPGETADVPSLVIGPVLALGVLAWWFWYRRDWGRARRLRHAWSRAVRDPRVLALPARRHDGQGPDPEAQHDFRVRESGDFAPFPGLRGTGGVSGGLDMVRAGVYPLLVLVALVAVSASWDGGLGGLATAAPVLPLLVVTLCATARAWRRVADSVALVGLQNDDRRRWTGWRVLTGRAAPAPAAPWYRRVSWVMLPVALGAAAVLVARVAAGEMTGGAVVAGLLVCAVPAALLLGSFAVRSARARSGGGTDGVAVQVLPDDVPPLGPTVVAPGPAVLRGGGEGVELVAGGVALPVPAGSGLVSGEPHVLATRSHWLVLPDGSQVALRCAAVRRVRELAGEAGLRVP